MHAESLAGAMGWLCFVALVGLWAGGPILLAAILRRAGRPRAAQTGSPPAPYEVSHPRLAFGRSPRTRPSPRHAVHAHRLLLTSGFSVALGLALMLFAATGDTLGRGGLLVAIALVVPTLIVALHAWRRSPDA